MKQTAVDWIEQKIVERIVRRNPHDTIVIQTQRETLIELFEQAKAMDRSQKAEEYVKGFKDGKEYQIKLDELTFKSE